MYTDITQEVTELENILSVCNACPHGDELPQVADHNQIVLMVRTEQHA